jgi:hypothetical protein
MALNELLSTTKLCDAAFKEPAKVGRGVPSRPSVKELAVEALA